MAISLPVRLILTNDTMDSSPFFVGKKQMHKRIVNRRILSSFFIYRHLESNEEVQHLIWIDFLAFIVDSISHL